MQHIYITKYINMNQDLQYDHGEPLGRRDLVFLSIVYLLSIRFGEIGFFNDTSKLYV